MKRHCIIIFLISLFFIPSSVFSQDKNENFFDDIGNIRLQTTELDALADTIAVINHRQEDIVWSRIVYRVIDMRDKQNYPLYFPSRPTDKNKSLFRVMLEAVENGINVYKRNPRDIKPQFDELLTGEELSRVFAYDEFPENNLVQVDPITEERTLNQDQYMRYIKNQIKFLIQEVIFFDINTSRLYTKIIAIAPMYALHPDNMVNNDTMAYFRNSVLCWFAFDELRPYLIKQIVTPNGNDSNYLTYDEFFSQKLYSSYLLGESNMYSRMLLEFSLDEETLRAEQKRIEKELMNFEQDLWEH